MTSRENSPASSRPSPGRHQAFASPRFWCSRSLPERSPQSSSANGRSSFENGEKREGGRLVVLRENPALGAPVQGAEAAPQTYVQPPSVVQVAPPTTTYVYREPVYVAPPVYYYPSYRYARPYYYSPNSLNFNYYGGSRHSRYGVGLGFGF